MKTTLFALAGIIISLNIYFNASAKVWKSPKGPTTLGPFLFGLNPELFYQTKLSLLPILRSVPIKTILYNSFPKIWKYSNSNL